MSKIKFNQDSKLLIRKIIDVTIDANGKKIIHTRWFVAEDPINLGSLAEPLNKEIVEYKYDVPNKQSNIFGGLFGR